jgi:predicted SAM-dependent methyltransferase
MGPANNKHGSGLVNRLTAKINNSHKVKAAMAAIADVLYPVISARRRLMLPSKLAARSPLWMHFGCGEIADRRFINVDARVFPHVDYVTYSPLMPAIPAGRADLIYACHVFEHISHYRGQIETLVRWRELLRPGGRLMLSVPDFDKVVGLRDARGFAWMQSVLTGGQDYPGNFHFAIFTEEHLRDLLIRTGFTNIEPWRANEQSVWPKDWSWDEAVSLNLAATRPE